jgi:hypothetical protein
MPSWLLPAVKLILPHVSGIVAAAKPVFTRRKSEEGGDAGSVTQQQITELQAAASQNAAHVKELAEQLRLTVTALQQGAANAEKRMKRLQTLAVAAAVISVLSLGLAVYALAV